MCGGCGSGGKGHQVDGALEGLPQRGVRGAHQRRLLFRELALLLLRPRRNTLRSDLWGAGRDIKGGGSGIGPMTAGGQKCAPREFVCLHAQVPDFQRNPGAPGRRRRICQGAAAAAAACSWPLAAGRPRQTTAVCRRPLAAPSAAALAADVTAASQKLAASSEITVAAL